MVLSTTYDEDDPRNIYQSRKLKATVKIDSRVRSSQTGVIKSDPDGKAIAELQNAPTSSTYRSHTGHGRFEVASSVGSNGSHTIDPNYYRTDGRDDSSFVSRRSAPLYSARSKPSERDVPEGSSVAARLAAYRKNAKTVSAPKVSQYSVAANKDRYLQSPMAPVAPGAKVVEVELGVEPANELVVEPMVDPVADPVVAERSVSVGSRSLNLDGAEPPAPVAEEKSLVPKKLEANSTISTKSTITAKSSASSNKSANSNKVAAPEPMISKEEQEQFDKTLEEAISQSQDYWAKLKEKQKLQKKMQKMKRAQERESSFLTCGGGACGGGYEDESTLDTLSEDDQWNMFDAILVGKDDPGADVDLVSREELLCDFEESGIDKIKELHQFLKTFASDGPTDIVGRDIVATYGPDDESSKSSVSLNEKTSKKKLGVMARFAALLATNADELKGGDEQEAAAQEAVAKQEPAQDPPAQEPAEEDNTTRSTDVHTVKYNHERETSKRKMRIATASYLAAAAASNGSVTSSEPSESKTPLNDTEPDELKIISDAPGSTLVPTDTTAMVEAGSAVSIKSVRFSEKVQTHEPEEVQAPDVPSLMDDQPEEDEASVGSSLESAPIAVVEDEGATKKKKGFLKKLFRKRKNKKNGYSEPFQPTLDSMNEEPEGESANADAPGDDSVNSAATAKSGNKSHGGEVAPTGRIPPSEGFELIAGCTKTGKKAIMIAKAKNERKRNSEDPAPLDPPTAAANKKNAASVAADAGAKNDSLSWMWFTQKSAEEKDVSDALDVIQQHASKRGVTERELMDHVEAKDNDIVENTFVSDGDSLFHGESTVASKLLNMFDSMFAEEVEEAESQSVESL